MTFLIFSKCYNTFNNSVLQYRHHKHPATDGTQLVNYHIPIDKLTIWSKFSRGAANDFQKLFLKIHSYFRKNRIHIIQKSTFIFFRFIESEKKLIVTFKNKTQTLRYDRGLLLYFLSFWYHTLVTEIMVVGQILPSHF